MSAIQDTYARSRLSRIIWILDHIQSLDTFTLEQKVQLNEALNKLRTVQTMLNLDTPTTLSEEQLDQLPDTYATAMGEGEQ